MAGPHLTHCGPPIQLPLLHQNRPSPSGVHTPKTQAQALTPTPIPSRTSALGGPASVPMRFPASGALLLRLALLLCGAAPAAAAYCTTDQIRQIYASVGHFGRATRCPDATWKEAFFAGPALQNASRPIVVYDIGCNKAFDALATWQSLTRRAIDFERWHEPYKGTPYSCGACNQCHGRPPPTTQGTPKQVRLFCVEPLPATFRIIYAGTARLGLQVRVACMSVCGRARVV